MNDKELMLVVAQKLKQYWYSHDNPDCWDEMARVIIPIIRADERAKVVEEIKELCMPLEIISPNNKGIVLTHADLQALKEGEA